MSAESPRKTGGRGAHIVAPQPVSDRSIIESVAGFINEVVPQAYTSLPSGEGKEAITWARFEYGDINDPALYPDTADDRSSTPPLLLVLGYCTGVQVWAIPANGEATEVLSWRQGVVRTLRVLPTPLADSPVPDAFGHKRPLVALCDSAGPGPQFCSLSFISLRGGDQVKSIKFKNPVSDVLANRRSVVVTFPERIAVFDACTLEDRLTVTTCYPCPGPNPNPVALGTRWLAYAERQFLHTYRSSGGTEGEGVQSYTATVLHAAKSLGKGLRELGETVASSLTGSAGTIGVQRVPGGAVAPTGAVPTSTGCDTAQPGVVTILDAQGMSASRGDDIRSGDTGSSVSNADLIVSHFAAHSEPIVAVQFDPSGMLLLTADKRGHDFHVFRIQPHPGGSSLAAVHHLYVLHRGDTTAKVQDIAFAADSRWVAVSTLRGTTHVFPITPYGGPVGIRTHTTPHVVNRLSRFHRSAGLTADGRNSPVPVPSACSTACGSYESTVLPPAMPYPNARLPPYPHPTIINPLAQIRQPITHTLLPGMPPMSPVFSQQTYRNPSARVIGRSQSVSDENALGTGILLRVSACFAAPRAWLVGSPTVPRESSNKTHKRSVDSLFVMACHGSLIEYDLEPKHSAGIPKEKICDDTAIELEVKAKAQWVLLRPPHSSELQPPLPASNPLMVLPDHLPPASESRPDDADERWLSQVEIVTHAGPHRRLWMGPQFTFKTYTSTTPGAPLSLLEMEAVEVGTVSSSRPARSNPVNMPLTGRPVVPVLIESGSSSSYEQSPRLMETYGDGDSDGSAGPGDTQLREDLADAMMESPGIPIRDTGRRTVISMPSKRSTFPIEKVVNPVGTVITVAVASDEETGGPLSPAPSSRGGERVLPAGAGTVDVNVVRWPTVIKHSMTQADTDGNNCTASASSSVFRQTDDEGRIQWPKGAASFTQNIEAGVDVSAHRLSRDLSRRNDSGCNTTRYRKSDVKTSLDTKPGDSAHISVGKEVLGKLETLGSSSRSTACAAKDFPKSWKNKTIGVDSDSVQEPVSGKCETDLSGILANIPSLSHFNQSGMPFERLSGVNTGGISVARRGKIESMGAKYDKVGEIETEITPTKKDDKTIPKKSKRSIGKQKDKEGLEHKQYELSHSQCNAAKEKLDVIEKVDKGPSDKILSKPSNKFASFFKDESKQTCQGGSQLLQDTLCSYQVTDTEAHADIIKHFDEKCQDMDKEKEIYFSPRKFKQDAVDCQQTDQFSVSNTLPSFRNDDIEVQKLFTDSGLEGIKSKSNSKRPFSNATDRSEDYKGASVTKLQEETKVKIAEEHGNAEELPPLGVVGERKKLEKHTSQFLVKELQKPAFSTIQAPPLKSWSSIVSSTPKEKTEEKKDVDVNIEKRKVWNDIASVGLDPGILSAACSSAEQMVVESPVLESVMKEDVRNNNQSKEELFVEALEEPVTTVHQCSWSNVVSSPKAGTSSSTDDGSGEYDSNDSKESVNIGLDELEERPSSKSASSEMVTASESLSASSLATPLEEDSSGTLIKILNDDEVSSDMIAVTSSASSKKNRRTKKKRR